jgi:hypothetical protein
MPDEIYSPLTWRTAVVSLGAALGLTAAAVGGLLLAGRGGGLARADRTLSVLPQDTVALALFDLAEVLHSPVLRERLEELLRTGRSAGPEGLVAALEQRFEIASRKAARAILFMRPGGATGVVLEGDLRPEDLRGPHLGEQLGIAIRRAGPALAAWIGEGRVVLGRREAVRGVLELTRGQGRSLAGHPLFSTLRDLSIRARDHSHLQIVILSSPGTWPPVLEAAWPALRGATAAGLFADLGASEAKVLALCAGGSAAGRLGAMPPGAGPLFDLLGAAKTQRREGLVELRLRRSLAMLGDAVRWLVLTVFSEAAPAVPRP